MFTVKLLWGTDRQSNTPNHAGKVQNITNKQKNEI